MTMTSDVATAVTARSTWSASAGAAMPRTPRSVISASGLTMSFDGTEVIHGMDFEIEPGTIIGLIGPSGCGKTTTVRLLTGLLTPTSGAASIWDTPTTELTSSQRARIGYLPQTPALFPDLSLRENLSFHASMYGLPLRRRRRIAEMLDWVELTEHRTKRVADSSGGMQRRLALAAAFVHDPEIVFLDEPTAGIDPILRDKFWTEFRRMADVGKTMVVTTQYVGEAGRCDVVGLLSDGDLLLLDTPENLRRAAFDGEVIDVRLRRPASPSDIERLRAFPFVVGEVEELGADSLRVVVDDVASGVDDLARALESLGIETADVREHVVDYDEAFVRVVKRHRDGLESEAADEEATDAEASADGVTDVEVTDVDVTDGERRR